MSDTRFELDVIIYAPLEAEYNGVQKSFPAGVEINGTDFTGYMVHEDFGLKIAVVMGFEFGNAASQDVWREVLSKYNPKVAICVGIAGGVSKDAQLGDVYYASSVIDLTQRAKIHSNGSGEIQKAYEPVTNQTSQNIRKELDRLRLSVNTKSMYRTWQNDCDLRNRGTLARVDQAKLTSLKTTSRSFSKPQAMPGAIASTNEVIASKRALEDLKRANRKTSCVDTESAGFMRELKRHPDIDVMVVRGISDLADEGKADLEEIFEEVFRTLAINNAVSFLLSCITSVFPSSTDIKTNKKASQVDAEKTILKEMLWKNENELSNELVIRSPMHKIVEVEIESLPVPRLRFERPVELIADEDPVTEAEIEDVLSIYDRIFVEMPITYPDTALPWHYASLLAKAPIRDRMTVPVIVEWSNFAPPNRTIQKHIESLGLSTIINRPDYQLVLIFPDFREYSENKTKFLSECLSEIKNACCIFFSNDRSASPYNSHLDQILSPEVLTVQTISFAATARYMSEALEMEESDAEVSAKRLMTAFAGHRLPLHPSYLAPINKDILSRLLNASRRGELVQITVTALLTLMVADDESAIRISVTGREDFLINLAVEIYAYKKQFSYNDLKEYVSELDKKMNYGIKPKEFIDTFVKSNIITVVDDKVAFPIPIIKSYMLSKGLLKDTHAAKIYFDFDDDKFDLNTFGLYTDKQTNCYNSRIKKSIDYFENKISDYDEATIEGRYSSRFLNRNLDLAELSKDISDGAEALVEAKSLASEKQALLDIQDEVSQTSTAKETSFANIEEFKDEYSAAQYFTIASMLLGNASERLNGKIKDEMIGLLLKLGGLMITDILTIRSSFKFDEAVGHVKNKLIESNNLEIKEEDQAAFHDFVELVIAQWDFDNALHPLLYFTHILCETGGSNILLTPLNDAKTKNALSEFLRTAWAFDMDPVTQKSMPKELSKMLGNSPFLRMAFAIFFYHRSYWFHSKPETRQLLADGVNAVLKPLPIPLKASAPKTDS